MIISHDIKMFLYKKYKKFNSINILLDTSGSTIAKCFNTLQFFPDKLNYFLYQFDTKIRKVNYITHKSQLNYITLHGCGGTMLNETLLSVMSRNKNPVVIITDGYCEEVDIDGYSNDVIVLLITEPRYFQDHTPIIFTGEKQPTQITVSVSETFNDISS